MIYKKIYKWSVFLTGLISFLVWHLIRVIKTTDIDGYLQLSENALIIIKFVIGACFSFGFFILIVSLFCWLIVKCKCIKRCFFGPSYIEGVWIGFGTSEDGEIVLIIQKIEQTSDEISIHGQTFEYNNGNPIHRSLWSSTGTSFDNSKHSLNFTYISNKMKEVNAGFCSHQFSNQGKKAPDMFFFFFANYGTHKKRFFMGKKYYDLENIPDLKVMINDAKFFYEDQKEYFNYHDIS
jgi:hypothetical protein